MNGFCVLYKFNKRYDINVAKIHGEAVSVNLETVLDWLKSSLPNLTKKLNKPKIDLIPTRPAFSTNALLIAQLDLRAKNVLMGNNLKNA